MLGRSERNSMRPNNTALLTFLVAFSVSSSYACSKRAASESDTGSVSPTATAVASKVSAAPNLSAAGAMPVQSVAVAHSGEADVAPSASDVELVAAEPIMAPEGIPRTPLFGCSAANFAWRAVFRGFVIDDAGRVWSFDHGRTWSAKLALDAGPSAGDGAWFERAQLLSMYSPAQSNALLPAPALAKYQALIESARRGKVTRTLAANDAGASGCEAYVWNAAHDVYQRVELGSLGNQEIVNDAAAASVLTLWLRRVEHALTLAPFAHTASAKRHP